MSDLPPERMIGLSAPVLCAADTPGAGVRTEPASAAFPEEVDRWWGSYSGWTMMPSCLVCVLLTALIAWGAWWLMPKGQVKLTIQALAGVLWLGQGLRFTYRVFGYNYRLTTLRLYLDRGLWHIARQRIDLTTIARVSVTRSGFERLAGIGHLRVTLDDKRQAPVLLEGARDPYRFAELLREAVRQARESSHERSGG